MKKAAELQRGALLALCLLLLVLLPAPVSAGEVVTAEPEAEELPLELPEENLLNGYARQEMNDLLPAVGGPRRSASNGEARFTGANAVVYRLLIEWIAEVAAGERSSTIFTIPLSALGELQTRWTAEELGLESLLSDGAITPAAMEAADAALGLTPRLIIKALVSDCPYELYWYNKTASTGIRSFGYSSDGTEIWFRGELELRFPVAADYQLEPYTVDSSLGATVAAARTNAQSIVENAAAYEDREKLDAYREEICRLASYNFDALSPDTEYGNPWQLIWVFDADETTQVVCEGYAKAFQYLCELSAFQGGVGVYTVTGLMNGSEAHMWNIVSMGEGERFLADLTNCDNGMAGWPDLLFLAGAGQGDVDTGYTIFCGSRTVSYQYDENTRLLFSEEELRLADHAYGVVPDPCDDGHDYVLDHWEWSQDHREATAVLVCTRNEEHRQELAAAIREERREPDCEERGQRTVTASVVLGETEFSEVWNEWLNPLGHVYAFEDWEWAEDHSCATARFVCGRSADHVNLVTVTAGSRLDVSRGGILYTAELEEKESPDFYAHRTEVLEPRTGWVRDENQNWFYLSSEGPATGWAKIDGAWYYFSSSGVMQRGWLKLGDNWYYLGSAMATGWKQVGSSWYYFNSSGVMQTGWMKLGNNWYYLGSAMATGWQKVGSNWYYFNSSGVMQTGWQKVNNAWYFFVSSGAMQTGWVKIGSSWYYFGTDGKMVTGWQTINSKTYYFKTNGAMAASEWCGGYWLNADGTWTYPYKASWHQNDKGWWYGDASGWYARNTTIVIDGRSYSFDANGYCLDP